MCNSTDLGADGFEIGKLNNCGLIILDLMLLHMDGYEILRRLRSAKAQTQILIPSGHNEPDYKIKRLELGPDNYFSKAFDESELIARIQAVVRRPEVGLEVYRVTATVIGTTVFAGFTASGLVRGDSGATSISRVVFDNHGNPVLGVTVRVNGADRQSVADAQGQLGIDPAPVGPVRNAYRFVNCNVK